MKVAKGFKWILFLGPRLWCVCLSSYVIRYHCLQFSVAFSSQAVSMHIVLIPFCSSTLEINCVAKFPAWFTALKRQQLEHLLFFLVGIAKFRLFLLPPSGAWERGKKYVMPLLLIQIPLKILAQKHTREGDLFYPCLRYSSIARRLFRTAWVGESRSPLRSSHFVQCKGLHMIRV